MNSETDPYEIIVISKADKVKRRKTYRRFITEGNSMGGSKNLSKHQIIPELKKVNNNLYEIVLNHELDAGEYAFLPIYTGRQASDIRTNSGKTRIYCFGIDQ